MKVLVVAVMAIACAPCLESQILVTPGHSEAGVAEVRIRNGGPVGVVAFALAMNPRQSSADVSPFVAFFDSLFDETEPLKPDGERTIPVLLRLRPKTRIAEVFDLPIITAAILADGSTAGDVVLLSRLMLRRCNRLLAVETAMDILSEAGRRNNHRDELVGHFRKMADLMWRWYVPPEQQIGRELYLLIRDKLEQLPDQPVGAPFPPSTFVEEQVKVLNRERVVLSASQPPLATAMLSRSR